MLKIKIIKKLIFYKIYLNNWILILEVSSFVIFLFQDIELSKKNKVLY